MRSNPQFFKSKTRWQRITFSILVAQTKCSGTAMARREIEC
jgi:hypothetical protein